MYACSPCGRWGSLSFPRVSGFRIAVTARPGSAPAPRAPELPIKIFGTKKCSQTRKAERFFKERRVSFQLVDIAVKGPSAGELRKIANAVGGMDKLIDRDGKRYVERGLKYAAPTGPRIEQILVDDPLPPSIRLCTRHSAPWMPGTNGVVNAIGISQRTQQTSSLLQRSNFA